ncbi:MAG: BMP family protein [Anaerolineae bacterium]
MNLNLYRAQLMNSSISVDMKRLLLLIIFSFIFGSCTDANVEPSPFLAIEPDIQSTIPTSDISSTNLNSSEMTCLDEQLFCVAFVELAQDIDYFGIQTRQAVERARVDLTAQVVYKQISEEEVTSVLEQFAAQDYDVIITVGGDLGKESILTYSKFSHPHFITINQYDFYAHEDHLIELNFPEYEAGFLAGVLAAYVTQSNVVAIVTPEESYSHQLGNGFLDGVASISDSIRTLVLTDLDNSLNLDANQVAEIVINLEGEGVDVIYAGGGTFGDMVLTEAAKNTSINCIGMVQDQWERLPEARPCLLTSTVYKLDLTLIELMARIALRPTDHEFHAAASGGFVGYASFRDYDAKLPAQVKAHIFEVRDELNQR